MELGRRDQRDPEVREHIKHFESSDQSTIFWPKHPISSSQYTLIDSGPVPTTPPPVPAVQ